MYILFLYQEGDISANYSRRSWKNLLQGRPTTPSQGGWVWEFEWVGFVKGRKKANREGACANQPKSRELWPWCFTAVERSMRDVCSSGGHHAQAPGEVVTP
ncbi:hypothetical protein M0802_001192 [Mischocyttarus mexicanus]|nr:hypothetical protein M0802_001192 [Mischocyttarus mexicanus]